MSFHPEMVRAALLVTAQNVDSGYWDPANHDGRDGAGTVSGANAVKFVTGADDYPVSFNPGPVNEEGAVVAGIDDDVIDANSSTQTYYYKTPEVIPEGMHLRVVLTWNSSPGAGATSYQNKVSDLGLEVEVKYSYWYVSDAQNGNVEMVDIDNGDLREDTSYQIRIVPNVFRKADDGPDYTNYSIAWTWVKDHAD